MQAVSKTLAAQMQQLQQQVADSIRAAAALRQEKQAATDQLHQVCSSRWWIDVLQTIFGWL